MIPVVLPRALLAKERKYRSFRMESTGRNLANHPRRSMVQPLGAVLFIALAALTPPPALAGTPVAVATYEGVINPVSAEYIHDALAFAQTAGAQALVIQLDTPGGLDTSMRLIIKDITASSLPVVVYVSPSGGRAASAGVFITLAAQIAAMAPGTNIGAAHPVAMGGGDMDKTMKEKVENDSVAYIKSIAEQRGRNVAWAEDAVRKSVSVTEKEALALKIIDLVAEDVTSLLDMLDRRTSDPREDRREIVPAGERTGLRFNRKLSLRRGPI